MYQIQGPNNCSYITLLTWVEPQPLTSYSAGPPLVGASHGWWSGATTRIGPGPAPEPTRVDPPMFGASHADAWGK